MNNRTKYLVSLTALAVLAFSFNSVAAFGQSRAPLHDRIAQRIEGTSTVRIAGNIHPLTARGIDQGRMTGWSQMNRITMVFKPTAEQQAALEALVEQQQDPASANYHQWLTPDQFAERFGMSTNDLANVVAWLQSHRFSIDEVAQSRQSIAFSGNVTDVESAFQLEMHQFSLDGNVYYANVSEPAVPAAIKDVVLGFRSLNNFRLKPRPSVRRKNDVSAQFTSSVTGNHFISPNDFATIYDLNSLYASGIDGTGQKIAIMGQTDVALSDIRAFRSVSGLAPKDPQVLLVGSDPGTSADDLPEADLDLEWSGAVAPNVQLIYVNSNDAFTSLFYAVDNNLAPIISISYGACEKGFSSAQINQLSAIGMQANAEGITILAASGDSGAADCEDSSATIATRGLSVDIPSAMPYVTGLGGSEFNESSSLWSANTNVNGTALSYLPEMAWNDTATDGTLSAGGGGHSIFYAKPTWQTGAGVPSDGARDVPDLSLSASPDHDGYLMCSGGSCVNGYRGSDGTLFVVGGTSVAAPSFAGIMSLIVQQTGSSQGNANPTLYHLAATSPSAFHDITAGGNQVPCQTGSADCTTGGTIGYGAGVGYDQATGLGSVDIAKLIAAWSTSGQGQTVPQAPTINGITPASASRSSTVSVTLSGLNLSGATAVSFGESGISASIQPGGTATALPLSVTVAANAAPTAVTVTVTTAGGSTTSTPLFTVVSPGVTVSNPLPISTVEQGNIQSGYVVITPDSGSTAPIPTMTYGMVTNGLVGWQAAVLPASMQTTATLFVESIPSVSRDLGVAIANPNSTASTASTIINLTLQDQNGQTIASTSQTLKPQQQLAKFVSELFGTKVIGSGVSGSLQLSSSTPFSVLGLLFNSGGFTTLSAPGTTSSAGVPVRTLIAGSQLNTPLAGAVGGSGAVVLPQFAMGGHWASVLALVNSGTTAISGRIDIFDTNGNPLAVNLNNSLQSTFRYSISGGGTFVLAPRDSNGQSPF